MENLEIKKDKKIKLFLKDEIIDKIQKLCSVINVVEWSGILLYTTEGNSISDPENFKINVQDIILMEKGTSTATSFNYNEVKRSTNTIVDRHIDYLNQNEEALTWRLGLIHSHHNMSTYFSPVDDSELIESSLSGDYNIFLSLIVNNNMDFVARVASKAEAEAEVKTRYKSLDENGEEYLLDSVVLKAKHTKVFAYDCEIISNVSTLENPYNNFFDKNLASVLEDKKSESVNNTTFIQPTVRKVEIEKNKEVSSNLFNDIAEQKSLPKKQIEEGIDFEDEYIYEQGFMVHSIAFIEQFLFLRENSEETIYLSQFKVKGFFNNIDATNFINHIKYLSIEKSFNEDALFILLEDVYEIFTYIVENLSEDSLTAKAIKNVLVFLENNAKESWK